MRIRVVSGTTVLSIAGHVVPLGESTHEIAEADLPAFVSELETATPDDLDRVRAAQIADRHVRSTEWIATFVRVLGRAPRAFSAVDVLPE